MKKHIAAIFLVVILLPAVACNRKGQENLPGIGIPVDDMNKGLHLSAPPEISTFKIGDDLGLLLSNSSDTPIILPQDYGVHIYQRVNEKWEPIENRMEYSSREKLVYPRDNQPLRDVVLSIYPFVNSNQPVTIRVVVVGNYYDEASGKAGKQVGAYTDITITPK